MKIGDFVVCDEAMHPCILEPEAKHILLSKTGTWRYLRPVLKTKTSACTNACPARMRTREWLKLIRQGKMREAWELVKEDNPLPAITGRVCYHPCEKSCNRTSLDEPIAIHSIERFIGDFGLGLTVPQTRLGTRKGKVAIIGSGPAGLTCSYYLARRGYEATIFETLPVAGGMLYAGIPEYRLPRKILEAEINGIRRQGVEIRTSCSIGKDLTITELFEQGHQAIFVATGAHVGRTLGIPGEDSDGVVTGSGFLRRVNLGKEMKVGERLAVIGGGNVAIDAARCALRLGSKEVFVLYRRSRDEMPASEEEINLAEMEGAKVECLVAPTEILARNGSVIGIRCARMRLGEPDGSMRKRPIPISGSEFDLDVDMVIPAIGQKPDLSFLTKDSGIEISEQGTLEMGPTMLCTSGHLIYAGGDVVSGPARVVDAIAAGKKAAEAISAALEGRELAEEETGQIAEYEDLNATYFHPAGRQKESELSLEQRLASWQEVSLGLDREAVVNEANRCFHCGACDECHNCWFFCPDMSMLEHNGRPEVNLDYCKGCGICAKECPCGALVMEEESKCTPL